MTQLIICDVETTGTDPDRDALIEIAACHFDADIGLPVRSCSWLIEAESNAAEHVNRIPTTMLQKWGWHRDAAINDLKRYRFDAGPDVVFVAHNAEFDRQWLDGIGERWACSMSATYPELPENPDRFSLVTLALAYGVGVVRAHRADADVTTLAMVLTAVHKAEGSLERWLASATEPRAEVLVSDVNFDAKRNEQAKAAGFHWVPERKRWAKSVRASAVAALREALPFRTELARPNEEGPRDETPEQLDALVRAGIL